MTADPILLEVPDVADDPDVLARPDALGHALRRRLTRDPDTARSVFANFAPPEEGTDA